jgi:tetratricopeptide (TPR) repeat protein
MLKRKQSSKKRSPQTGRETSVLSALPFGILAGVALIAAAVFIVYLPSINGGFVLDDDQLLTANKFIRASDGLFGFWCTTESVDYWPVTSTVFWIEWRLWGVQPTGYHVTNLILHIVEALLIWLILRKLAIPGAFWAALIFAVHPVNVESVAWIAQRKDMMAMLFLLLSIAFYLKYFSSSDTENAQSSRHTPCADPARGVCGVLSGRWYWLSMTMFVLAMLGKGSVAMLPALLLGIVWWLRQAGTVPIFVPTKMGLSPFLSKDLIRLSPFFLVAMVLTWVNVWFQTHGSGEVVRSAGFAERVLGAGGVLWFYLYKALLPIDLAFVYPQWHIEAGNPLWWLPLLAALALTALLWWYRKGWSRPFLFAWGFFGVSLTPVLGFKDVGFMKYSLVADHYQHTAIIGVIALATAGWNIWRRLARVGTRWVATALAVAAVGVFAILTWRQSGLYRDAMTLYQATLEKNQDCWMAHNNLGSLYVGENRTSEAIEHFQQAMRLNPKYPDVYSNLGVVFIQMNRPLEAIKNCEQALRLKPAYPEAQYNLGLALAHTGRLQEAIEHYQQALALTPYYPDAENDLGSALLQTGRPEEAVTHFQQALRLRPNFLSAHYNLGSVFTILGKYQQAIEHYSHALSLKYNDPDIYIGLGGALLQTGRPEEAIAQYQNAILLKPTYTEVYYYMALAYASLHQSSNAIAAAQKALELARSQGKTPLAKQIEDWLNAYRASLSGLQNAPPSVK